MTVGSGLYPDWLKASAETRAKLEQFERLVRRWNPAINLVARNSLHSLWDRHILDSAQIFDLAPESATTWVDLGSGGGFPGLVVAILAEERRPELRMMLVESDRRKAVFLAQAARELGLSVDVQPKRIEEIAAYSADVISARALASLTDIFGYAIRHLKPAATLLLPKGQRAKEEVDEARANWTFSLVEHQSLTDPIATILSITDLEHA